MDLPMMQAKATNAIGMFFSWMRRRKGRFAADCSSRRKIPLSSFEERRE